MTLNFRTILNRWPIRTIALTVLSYFILGHLLTWVESQFGEDGFTSVWIGGWVFFVWVVYTGYPIGIYLIKRSR